MAFAEDESTAAIRRFGLIISDPVLVRLFFSARLCALRTQLLSRCSHFRRSLNSRAVLACKRVGRMRGSIRVQYLCTRELCSLLVCDLFRGFDRAKFSMIHEIFNIHEPTLYIFHENI